LIAGTVARHSNIRRSVMLGIVAVTMMQGSKVMCMSPVRYRSLQNARRVAQPIQIALISVTASDGEIVCYAQNVIWSMEEIPPSTHRGKSSRRPIASLDRVTVARQRTTLERLLWSRQRRTHCAKRNALTPLLVSLTNFSNQLAGARSTRRSSAKSQATATVNTPVMSRRPPIASLDRVVVARHRASRERILRSRQRRTHCAKRNALTLLLVSLTNLGNQMGSARSTQRGSAGSSPKVVVTVMSRGQVHVVRRRPRAIPSRVPERRL